ncbi:restriction endonuclease subunit S [Streptomyces fradiae]|uniref:restriction endonuclease subunit S n=1 Tax=Streptomyces fradiae TaxID=1906 RepID=UPI0033F4159A
MKSLPLKYVAKINAGQSPPSAEVSDLADDLPFLQGNAEFQTEHPLPRFQCATAPKAARVGDILISVRAPVGALNVADRRYGIGRGLCAITPSDCDGRFLWWWLHAQRARLNAVSTGTTYRAVTAEDVGGLPFPQLDIAEQRRIAKFLDGEAARIDKLLTLLKELLAKLGERETAELDVAIDDLADRFGTAPLRRFIWAADQGVSPQCDGVPADEGEWGVLKVSCLRPGIFIPEENKRLPEGTEPATNSEVREGDLLITRANTPQLVGSTAVVPRVRRKLLLPDKIFRIRLAEGMHPEFIATIARGSHIRALCAASSNGASQSMANIRFEEVKGWPIPAIRADEQLKFIKRTSHRRERINALRPAVDRQLNLLTERRQALITAAVTGQIDVSTASGRGIEE